MYRFFAKLENIYNDKIVIDGSDVNHIKNVLRLKCGDTILISDGRNKDYECCIESIDDIVTAQIVSQKEGDKELPSRIYLFQGIPKGDKMELIIQKATELGAYEIIPVAMKRCVVKLDDKKAASKIKRWQTISESAAKQCGRIVIPEIKEVMTYKQAIEYAGSLDIALVPYELEEGMEGTRKALEQITPGMSIGVFIGPEGGFETEEVETAQNAGFHPISLGRRILRTETAGLTALSILMYYLETDSRQE